MEYNENENDKPSEDQSEGGDYQESSTKLWLRDNLRIIVSVLIVVVIAGGIYSYSKRTEAPTTEDTTEQSSIVDDLSPDQTEKPATDENKTADQGSQKKADDKTSSIASSQETDKSFVETAGRGDGTTHLARRALANYLEKNADSSLKAEHKIYIEDYLRRKIATKGAVKVGTSVEFSKDLIAEGISKSKSLNDAQINNLHKYAVRVPSLS